MGLNENREIRAALALVEAGLEAAVASEKAPGLSAAVVHDQEVLWARGFSLADVEAGRPAEPDTVYRVASVTKLFTATMLMQLRDEGKVSLDNPLAKYLPEVPLPSPDADPRPVTLRQATAHLGGIPRDLERDYFNLEGFPETAEFLAMAGLVKLVFGPLSHYKYSNVGATLLGRALERRRRAV